MTREEYFDTVHKKISQELHISPEAIATIRSFALGPNKLSRGQILLWVREKLDKSGKQTNFKKVAEHLVCSDCTHLVKQKIIKAIGSPSPKYLEIERFIKLADERTWKDITFPYSYIG